MEHRGERAANGLQHQHRNRGDANTFCVAASINRSRCEQPRAGPSSESASCHRVRSRHTCRAQCRRAHSLQRRQPSRCAPRWRRGVRGRRPVLSHDHRLTCSPSQACTPNAGPGGDGCSPGARWCVRLGSDLSGLSGGEPVGGHGIGQQRRLRGHCGLAAPSGSTCASPVRRPSLTQRRRTSHA